MPVMLMVMVAEVAEADVGAFGRAPKPHCSTAAAIAAGDVVAGSNWTRAEFWRRLTVADATPGSAARARSIAVEQAAQCMPSMSSVTVLVVGTVCSACTVVVLKQAGVFAYLA